MFLLTKRLFVHNFDTAPLLTAPARCPPDYITPAAWGHHKCLSLQSQTLKHSGRYKMMYWTKQQSNNPTETIEFEWHEAVYVVSYSEHPLIMYYYPLWRSLAGYVYSRKVCCIRVPKSLTSYICYTDISFMWKSS